MPRIPFADREGKEKPAVVHHETGRLEVHVFGGSDKDETSLIVSGFLTFAATDDLTVEKKTDEIPLNVDIVHPDDLYLLAVEKPKEDTAGNLTLQTYNMVTLSGTAIREVLHTSHTVEQITGADTYRDFVIQGLFLGEKKIKLGMKFAVDAGEMVIYYRLYRL